MPSRDVKYHHRLKLYQTKWEKEPAFIGWLAPIPDNSTRAVCKLCHKEMNAVKETLITHTYGKLHRKRLRTSLEEGTFAEGDSIKERPLPPWATYKKKYSEKWRQDPNIGAWVLPHLKSEDKVRCRYCQCSLRAHRSDLYKHNSSAKHLRSMKSKQVEDEENSSDSEHGVEDCHQQPLSREGNERITYNFAKELDDETDELVNKVGDLLKKDLKKILSRRGNILRIFKQSGHFSSGEEGVKRMAMILIGHLSQHYLVESAVESWKLETVDNCSSLNISSKLREIEEKMEDSFVDIRSLKMQVEETASKGPMNITLDTIDLEDLANATINITAPEL